VAEASSRRALVTGGAGFIGSNLVDRLNTEGCEVRVLDDLSAGFETNLPSSVELIVGDVVDEELVRKAVTDVDVVFHQAARRTVARSIEFPMETDRVNTHGTLTVLTAARDAGVGRVVYASSSSVYGGAARVPTPEGDRVVPRSPYAVSKLAGEQYCRVFTEVYGLETVALRYFNVYGPRQHPDSRYAAVVPGFITALRRGDRPVVYGDGEQTRDFTFVADVVNANLAAMFAPPAACAGNAYNVSGGGERSVMELLDALATIIGVSPRAVHREPRPGDVRRSRADLSAAFRDLQWAPTVGWEEGLRSTVTWFAR
jgi:UDP-glucose 4-epimerase